MERYSEIRFHNLVRISRAILMMFFLLLIGGLITGNGWLGLISVFLAILSWIVPGLLLIAKSPWFAFAWLRGMNPVWFPSIPWEQLSYGKKLSVYFASVIFFILAITAIVFIAVKNIRI